MSLVIRLRRAIRAWAFPAYDCKWCVYSPQKVCYCQHYGAVAPGVGPGRFRAFVQRLVRE